MALCADRAPGTVGERPVAAEIVVYVLFFLKHERMAVAMNLATIQHHSFLKSGVGECWCAGVVALGSSD